MTSTSTTATRADKYGFPIVTCYRCGGSGEHSFTPRFGSVCFGCNGSGLAHKRGKSAKAYAAFLNAQRKGWRPVMADVNPGELVASYGTKTFREVAEVIIDESDSRGYSKVGDVITNRFYGARIVFTDGTVITGSTNMLVSRRLATDPAPFVAAATGKSSSK